MFDLGLATQNLLLITHSLGLGTVVVGLFDHRKASAAVAVPEGYEPVARVPVGYPAQQAQSPKRREVSEFAHNSCW
jgi:nitroreductase